MKRNAAISGINFRDKKWGWKKKNFTVTSIDTDGKTILFTEPKTKNIFQKGFLQNLFLRPSCYNCSIKSLKSGSDITLGDYWGIQNVLPEFDDDNGISLVMINTKKGKQIYELLSKEDHETEYTSAIDYNPNIEKSVCLPEKRALFFERWNNESIIPLIDKLTIIPLKIKLKKIIAFLLHKMGLLNTVKSLLSGKPNKYFI
jgi:coenzyme F420-reducing hydrogenase beta subunit